MLLTSGCACVQMGDFERAVEDCDSVLGMKQDTKALLRRGMALAALDELPRAKNDFVHVLSMEPNNRSASTSDIWQSSLPYHAAATVWPRFGLESPYCAHTAYTAICRLAHVWCKAASVCTLLMQ